MLHCSEYTSSNFSNDMKRVSTLTGNIFHVYFWVSYPISINPQMRSIGCPVAAHMLLIYRTYLSKSWNAFSIPVLALLPNWYMMLATKTSGIYVLGWSIVSLRCRWTRWPLMCREMVLRLSPGTHQHTKCRCNSRSGVAVHFCWALSWKPHLWGFCLHSHASCQSISSIKCKTTYLPTLWTAFSSNKLSIVPDNMLDLLDLSQQTCDSTIETGHIHNLANHFIWELRWKPHLWEFHLHA